jgi:subtilisin-like proprotein convertase family protein
VPPSSARTAICLGAISWGNGWCVEDSFAGTFQVGGGIIPDGDPAGLVSSVTVGDLASVPIDIAVWIDLDHPDPQSLTYRLIDPNGADATLSAPGEGNRADILWRNITSDDQINGSWSLEIIDPVSGDTGVLNGWTLYLTSTWD